MIDTIRAFATGFQRCRENYQGPVFSEGRGSDFYTIGLHDGSYTKIKGYYNGKGPDQDRAPLLVDFAIKKMNPLSPSISINIGYLGYADTDVYGGGYKFLHQFLATQIAFGTIGSLEPYSVLYPNIKTVFDVTLDCYYLIREIQERYIMEEVLDIRYFDGEKFITTSQAVADDKYQDNMVCIRYKNGLIIYVNCNWDGKNWSITEDGKNYLLPPGGWFAKQGSEFIEFSSLIDGDRVDYVDSPDYTYLNSHGKKININGIETDRIKIKFKKGEKAGTEISFPE